MSDSSAQEGFPDPYDLIPLGLDWTGDVGDGILFFEGIRQLRADRGQGYPITANTTAHLIDVDGRCTLESRQHADHLLRLLTDDNMLARTGVHDIAGDAIPLYDFPS
ncbi:MAG TPA: hypothetical protein VLF87_02155 [Patescibacteria group bacterium]|nr:hypothetical protein [Patescibacteria group bacterium]